MSNEVLLDNAIRGVAGRFTPGPGDREYLDHPTQRVIRDLVGSSGAKPGPAQVYIAKRIRYHLGKGNPPTPPRELGDLMLVGWADARAWELVDHNRHRLPPVRDETEPRS
jgi:hypothetical protein